jgi:hypothetical protein
MGSVKMLRKYRKKLTIGSVLVARSGPHSRLLVLDVDVLSCTILAHTGMIHTSYAVHSHLWAPENWTIFE